MFCREELLKRHALCEMICEYSVEGSLKEGVCVGRYVNFLWKSL